MIDDVIFLFRAVSLTEESPDIFTFLYLDPWTCCPIHSLCLSKPRLAVYIYIEICLCLSRHLLPSLSVCLSPSISFSLTSVKCNWRSSLHMAHRHGGDIVCAVAANCSPCSSEPIPLLHFSPPPPPPLFILCPYSHYFISQPSLSPLSSPFLLNPCCLTQLFHLLLRCLQQV